MDKYRLEGHGSEKAMSFKSPNFTQVPNDFFDMIPEMTDAELRTTLVLIRQTFGYHKDAVEMQIPKIAQAAGLSVNGAKEGAKKAEERGTFRRTNPNEKTSASWELVVQPSASDGQPVTVDPQPVTVEPSASDPQVGYNKGNKIIKKKKDYLDLIQDMATNAGMLLSAKVEEVFSRMDSEFKTNFPRNKNTEVIAKFILAQEEKGQSFEKFAQWARRDEFNASRLYEYAENPLKIKIRWPQAFVETKYEGALEGV